MIAARLAGGNLFLPFLGGGFFGWGIFWVGDFLGGGFFGWGIFWVGDFLEHSERLGALGALGFFLRGVVGCVLDCKCWKKLKND